MENVNASIVNVDPKTYRKWTWIFVNLIADLEIVGFKSNIFFNISFV